MVISQKFYNFDVRYLQQYIMEKAIPRNLFLKADAKVLTDFKIKQTNANQKSKQPKRFAFFLILLLALATGVYIYNNINQPEPELIHQQTIERLRLEQLTEKVKLQELTETEWNELCELLASVKGIHVNDCENCRHYIKALLDVKHDKMLRDYKNKPDKELQKGIKSLQKRIDEHIRKTLYPKDFFPHWDELPLRQRDGLVNKRWVLEIELYKQQKQILECILKNR